MKLWEQVFNKSNLSWYMRQFFCYDSRWVLHYVPLCISVCFQKIRSDFCRLISLIVLLILKPCELQHVFIEVVNASHYLAQRSGANSYHHQTLDGGQSPPRSTNDYGVGVYYEAASSREAATAAMALSEYVSAPQPTEQQQSMLQQVKLIFYSWWNQIISSCWIFQGASLRIAQS